MLLYSHNGIVGNNKGIASHFLLILVGIVLVWTIIGFFAFSKLSKKISQIQKTQVQLATEYENPFDLKTQYVNPFDQYKSPFLNVR